MDPTTAKAVSLRLLLFLVLPIAIVAVLEMLIPLSMLLSSVIFLPFQAHSLDHATVTGPRFTIFAEAPWMYISNGSFLVIAALVATAIGRRYSLLTNVALYLGITVALAAVTHTILVATGFPFGADSP